MTTTLLTNTKIFNHQQELVYSNIGIIDGKIAFIGKEPPQGFVADEVLDGRSFAALPGYIDLHTHGALGHEMIGIDADGLQAISQFYASHGVTGFLATPWTAPREDIRKAIEVTQEVMGHEKGARILGIHLEGPFLNVAVCGAQDKSMIRTASRDEAMEYLDSGLVKLIALAPEFPENQWLIEECAKRNITVAAGHTNATYVEIKQAVGLGVRQVTHCFNAMRPLNHREPGVVGAAFDLEKIKCELITDNIHINPVVMRILYKIKGPEGVILITDSISATGMPDGNYTFEGMPVTVKDGAVRLADGTLAGSTLTMDRAFVNFIQATGAPIAEVLPCTSYNAAQNIGLGDRKGKLAEGYDAALILVDQNLHVKLTMVEGSVVYKEF
ncbi:N-acetylglucosamine-6-phosphate deacetylase [bioreactor metagenome]|uniref:N-acetylglucosamine-6-phosphate deacetylase n=1 Tax=bioreactor metagenome TaxID=1076179 RepID=A0A644Y9A9_9ZZZZ